MTISPNTTDQDAQQQQSFEPSHAETRTIQPGSIVRETVPVGPRSRLDHRGGATGAAREPDTAATAIVGHWGSVARIVFGTIWLVDVYFKWQPSFLNGLPDIMRTGAMGQPNWLSPWFTFTHAVIALNPVFWAYSIATVETAIALALLLGIARKITYLGGAIWTLMIWSTAEGFGRTPSGIATDIGAAIIYAVVFVAFLALDRCEGTRPYSVDALIERWAPSWRRLAEVRR